MNKYKIENIEEANSFNRMLHSFWVDSNNSWENSEEILKYYLRQENYSFIDTKQNNQISLYIAFSARNDDLFNLLVNNKNLKNKNYSLQDLNRFMASDEGLDNIIFCILENISIKNESSFDLTELKSKKIFIQSACDYFVFNLELNSENNQQNFKNLDKFIKITKCKFYKNEYQILNNLLLFDTTNGFLHLFDSTKNIKQKNSMLNFERNSVTTNYSQETEEFLEKLKLNFFLSQNLNIKLNQEKQTKMKI